MKETKQFKFRTSPAIIASLVMLVSFFDWPYSYYILLKVIVTGTAIYYAYCIYQAMQRQNFWQWVLAGIAFLFNPIIPIHLYNKAIWEVIDIIVIAFLIGSIIKLKKINDRKRKIQNNQE